MPYIRPASVIAPRSALRAVDVLYETGEDGWAVAQLNWNGDLVLGIRWNGGLESSLGTPNARGIPTWFIVPPELEEVIRERIETLVHAQPGGLLEGYSQMSQDESREREAEEWSEGLIGDASAQG
ncbi:MAG TPA: hypothetical protein VK555_03460 [Terriglobales bacterium]|jgi:hypothetical protein|nr:hypothetical protein [Terriglobales bacterium]